MIRYDGLYVSETAGEYRYYLRFFSSGEVVSASVVEPSKAQMVGSWLGMPGNSGPKGRFQEQAGQVSFETVFPGWVDYRDGTEGDDIRVEYEGSILEDGALMLKSHSFATGYRDELRYRFEPL
jgi:hypothetical protein